MKKYAVLIQRNWFYIAMAVVAIIYLFFPSHNLSIDSYAYGCNVKYGENLFWPHHLLYSYFNYLVYNVVQFMMPSVDALRLMQFTNGFFALLCLVLIHIIINKRYTRQMANSWTFFIAACFAVVRFATDSEAYIIPIFFSLLSSYFFLCYLKSQKSSYVLFCGLFASLACLFHQVHLFWGIGLFLGFLLTKNFKSILIYSLITLSVLVVYSLVMVLDAGIPFSIGNLWAYLADYYYSDGAETTFGTVNFVMTPVSFFRTFFQVHGSILNTLKLIPAFYVVIAVVVLLIGLFLHKLKSIRRNKNKEQKTIFETTHLLIFILQLAFAFFSHGNAEFMVMLPFLIPLFIYKFVYFNNKAVVYMGSAMLLWNFCFAVFPNNYFDYHNNKALIAVIEENPDKVFLLKEKNTIINQYYYETGRKEGYRLIDEYIKDADLQKLTAQHKTFYTDVLTKQMPFSRNNIVNDNVNAGRKIVFIQHIQHIDSALGGFYVDEVQIIE